MQKSQFYIILSIIFAITAGGILYYLLIYIPKRDALIESNKQQSIVQQKNEKNILLKQQAIKKCDEIFQTMIETIRGDGAVTKQKVDITATFFDKWNKELNERCIKQTLNDWTQ